MERCDVLLSTTLQGALNYRSTQLPNTTAQLHQIKYINFKDIFYSSQKWQC